MKETYITRAILKDYLTIKEVDITFNKDINIIIGQNGTGKTNFINYLGDSINTPNDIANNNSQVYFTYRGQQYKKVNYISTVLSADSDIQEVRDIDYIYDGDKISETILTAVFKATKVIHGIPKSYAVIDSPLNDSIKKTRNGYNLFKGSWENIIQFRLAFGYVSKVMSRNIDIEEYDLNLIFEILNNNLLNYSNIEKVRIGENLKVTNISDDEVYFNNLYLEYFVNDEWLLFNQLSDGTKRLFYLISEITLTNRSIVLLEEPELGLHPHQLYKLMEFIREMSDKQQFIITTHSPIVLNMLQKDELDSIIIATIEKGSTKLNHLTEEQIEKARAYMDVADLSDYWMHSDLEKA